MKLRYAFDLGTNSIGWAVYRLVNNMPAELIDAGVRIMSDGRNPKDGQSLAVMRRTPRSARRRRDRFLQRRDWLMTLLVRHGLMPEDTAARKSLEGLDPYDLRCRALDHRLEPFEIGRALFHLNQRRGFKSNRITDTGDDDQEKGKIAEGAARLRTRLSDGGWRTLGEYYASMPAGPSRTVRVRMNGEGAKAAYDFYPVRDLLEDEFKTIWSHQADHHPDLLTDEARDQIFQAMFFQRPLKAQIVGRCTFNPTETRLAVAQPLAQAFRIYQELANLKVEEPGQTARKLTLAERDILAEVLLAGDDLTFPKMRKLLKLAGKSAINLEEGGRDRLKGDATVARLSGKKGALSRLWPNLSENVRAELVTRQLDEPDAEVLKVWLIGTLGATAEEASAVAGFRPPDGHLRVGPTAAAAVVDQLKTGDPANGITIPYSEACSRAGFHHSDERDGEIFDRLPDYREVLERYTIGGTGNPDDPTEKRLGRITNPTVHIGLNQLRRVTNRLIEAYGPPDQIVLELARDLKQTGEDKKKTEKLNRENELSNRRRTTDLEAAGLEANGANLRLLRLWEELGPLPRQCVYTGRTISFSDVFSSEVEVEHILPFSRTLDDSMANRTLAWRDANRGKRNMSPAEAWGGAELEAIQGRAEKLPPNKRWRFKADAMERFDSEERGFLDRQLNDTRYFSRIAKTYLTKVAAHPDQVWVVTGQMTALLRARWGLNFSNAKDRNNHRHHAIDAATIGVIDRALLSELSRRAGSRESGHFLADITKDVPDPPGFVLEGRNFRDNVKACISRIIVSHKPEHGTGGALHEDTAYGIVDPARAEDGNLVFRKPIESLTTGEIDRVRDLNLRSRLQALRDEVGGNDKVLSAALKAYGAENGAIRRVRILKVKDNAMPVLSRETGQPYKALIPGENHHMDIVEDVEGNWTGHAVSVFDANRANFEPEWRRAKPPLRLVMRLHKGDLLKLADADGVLRVKRVVRIEPSANRVRLADHDQAGALDKRHKDPDDAFHWDFANISRLKARGCTPVRVDEMGRCTPLG